jgi:hypothetical protein
MKKLSRFASILLCIIILIMAGCSSNESQSASTQLPGGQSQSASSSSGGPQASSGGQSGGQMIEPKQLISKEEAAQLIGEAVKDGSTDEQPVLGMKICFYPAENSASKAYLQIAVIQAGMLQQGQQQSSGGGSSGGSGSSGGGSGSSGGGASSSPSSSQGGGGGSELTTKGIFEALKKAMEDLNAADTGRIGDDNFITAQGMGILANDYYIFVSAGSNNAAGVPAIVKAAGELAVRNLKRIQGQ